MNKLTEGQVETPTTLEIYKENFRKDFEEFISYWEKEAEELKNREITDYDSQAIRINYAQGVRKFSLFRKLNSLSFSDDRKFDLIESKLETSLAIARSNFRSKHRTIWERLADNFGIKFHIGKGH